MLVIRFFSKPLSKLVLAYIPTTLAYEQNRPKAHGSAVEEDAHTHSHRQSAFAMPLGPSLKVLVRPGVILVLCQHTEGLEGGIPPTDAEAASKGPRSHVGHQGTRAPPTFHLVPQRPSPTLAQTVCWSSCTARKDLLWG